MFTIIILLSLIITTNTSYCSDQNNCIDCLFLSEIHQSQSCSWNTTRCESRGNPSDYDPDDNFYSNDHYTSLWFGKFETSCSIASMTDSAYCGQTNYDISDQISISLPQQSEGEYGKANLFCKYTINNNHSKKIILNITQKIEEIGSSAKFAIVSNYIDDDSINVKSPSKDEEIYTAFNCEKIDIYFASISSFTESPFFISVEVDNLYRSNDSKNNISFVVGFVIGIASLILIIVGSACLILKYKIQNNERRNDNQQYNYSNQQYNNNHLSEREMNVIEGVQINNQSEDNINNVNYSQNELDILLAKTIFLIQYNKMTNDYNDSCTICLNAFNEGETVAKTPCFHLFHVKCIKEFLAKRQRNSCKCPNCNSNLKVN